MPRMSRPLSDDALERTATLSPSQTETLVEATRPARPERIGRFVVEDELGRGGMGVVYRALDPLLGRPVAVKLVAGQGGGSEGRTRLLREAQAIAQLQHPNVVAVHDVGEHEGQVYLAMEFLTGRTLREWQSGKGPRERLEAYLSAGRGLVAAHAVGLVHRDFKPDNVSVDDSGRVRLLDFGLARAAEGAQGPPVPLPPDSGPLALDSALTVAGTVMGTPAYMAPEQIDGLVAGPAADQFSFCASLWEALTRRRPFDGHDLDSLRAAQAKGPPPPPDTGWRRAVLAVLARGLAEFPEDRFPTLQACLEAVTKAAGDTRFDLEVGRHQRRLFLVAATIAGIVVEAGFQVGYVPIPKTADALVPLGLVGVVLVGSILALGYKVLTSTDINRRIAILVGATVALSTVNRLVGAHFDADVDHVLATDMVLMGALFIGGTSRQARWFAAGAAIQLVSAFVAAAVPGWGPHVFTADVLVTSALLAWFWER